MQRQELSGATYSVATPSFLNALSLLLVRGVDNLRVTAQRSFWLLKMDKRLGASSDIQTETVSGACYASLSP